MAGALTISTLNNDTGVLATQNGMTGIAKAWVTFNGSGGASISASFNVSSVTRNSTGNYTVNFTTAMPNANYAIVGNARSDNTSNPAFNFSMPSSSTPSTTAFTFFTGVSNSQLDSSLVHTVVYSS